MKIMAIETPRTSAERDRAAVKVRTANGTTWVTPDQILTLAPPEELARFRRVLIAKLRPVVGLMLPPGLLWDKAAENLADESLEALCDGAAHPTFLIAKLQMTEPAADSAAGAAAGEGGRCEIRSVLDVRRTKHGDVLYKVRWKGESKASSWLPVAEAQQSAPVGAFATFKLKMIAKLHPALSARLPAGVSWDDATGILSDLPAEELRKAMRKPDEFALPTGTCTRTLHHSWIFRDVAE